MTTITDIERDIQAVKRQMEVNTPRDFAPAEFVLEQQFKAVADKVDVVYQAVNLVPPPSPGLGESVDAYRLRVCQGLQHATTLSQTDIRNVAADRALLDRTEQRIHREALQAAHAAPDLREVKQQDQQGRVVSSFYGAKRSWMSPYQAPRLLMTGIDGRPVGPLPTILS